MIYPADEVIISVTGNTAQKYSSPPKCAKRNPKGTKSITVLKTVRNELFPELPTA